MARKQKRVARLLSFILSAAAATTSYAGLSSEFAYYDRAEPPCFGFAAPKPTRTEYLGQSIDWRPYLTRIWIKRLRGREVTLVGGVPLSVSWTQKSAGACRGNFQREQKAMSTDMHLSASEPPAPVGFSLPRFPVRWAVESAAAERIFSRLLWLLVPLQYYVVTHIGRGFSPDDLIPAVLLSLISVVVIFVLSCAAAWLASPLDETRRQLDWTGADVGRGADDLHRRRLFAAGAVTVATHVAIDHGVRIYGDLVTDRLMWLLRIGGLSRETMERSICRYWRWPI